MSTDDLTRRARAADANDRKGSPVTRIDTTDQLDALPIGSIVKTGEGWAARRMGTSYAQCWDVPETFRRGSYPPSRLIEHGPLTLLFVPGRDLVQEAQADAWEHGHSDGWNDAARYATRPGHVNGFDWTPTPNPHGDKAP